MSSGEDMGRIAVTVSSIFDVERPDCFCGGSRLDFFSFSSNKATMFFWKSLRATRRGP